MARAGGAAAARARVAPPHPGRLLCPPSQALNKLKVFGLTRFRKVIWMDSDDYVVRNIDHLVMMPPLTGSLVTACCHGIGPAYPGGGIWVLEPSADMFAYLLDLLSKPRPGTTNDIWCVACGCLACGGEAPPPRPGAR